MFQREYKCKHLIVTIIHNKSEERQIVDVSKFKEKSIVHYIMETTDAPPKWLPGDNEIMTEYWGQGRVFLEECEEGEMWCFE